MEGLLADLRQKVEELFVCHGLRIRTLFHDIARRHPSQGFLFEYGPILSRFGEILQECESSSGKSLKNGANGTDKIAFYQLSKEIFEEYSVHLQDCVSALRVAINEDFQKYKKIVGSKNSRHALSGKYPSDQSLLVEIEKFDDDVRVLIQMDLDSMDNCKENWDQHFGEYYKAIGGYQKCIETMNRLFDEDKKKWTDNIGVKLRVASIVLAVFSVCVATAIALLK
jgi:hypothetical protein